ncbi:MAG: DNA polymerase III subunit delta [Clostridia bacterium]|nr:DNA polymerase III subunit delta [Clostridia bacterium]
MIYLNYGEEEFLRDYNTKKQVESIELKNPGMNLVYLNEETIGRLPEYAEQMPFFDEKKIIVVKKSGLFASGSKKLNASLVEDTLEYLAKIPDFVELIFNEEDVDKRLTAYKQVSKIAKCTEYKYNSITDLANWIVRGMKKEGGEIDLKVAEYLAESCGPSMTYLYTEVKKLAVLAKTGVEITNKTIDDVCMKSEQGIIFDLTDSIGNKNSVKAVTLINDLVLQKQAEQYLLIMIYKHIRNLYMMKLAGVHGAPVEELGINPYVLRKLNTQVNKFSQEELKNLLKKLIELDKKSKSGDIDARIGLETIVLGM